jgi:hypothetical protein
MPLRMSEIFVPGGQPEYTYVPRDSYGFEDQLRATQDNLCKLVTVTGPTKAGKSVLAKKVFRNTNTVWIDGGSVSTEADFWDQVIEKSDAYTTESNEDNNFRELGSTGETGGQLGFPFLASLKGKVSAGVKRQAGKKKTKTRTLSGKTSGLKALSESKAALIIDDFHYLPRDAQGSIIRAVKPLVFDGRAVVILAIPHRRYDAVKVEKEMTGRIQQIRIPPWNTKELARIPQVGFPLLNVAIHDDLVGHLAEEALGSPHLIQDFCRGLCELKHVREKLPNQVAFDGNSDLTPVFVRVAEGTSKTVFDKLARGPRARSDRKKRDFRNGSTGDIYQAVLTAIASLKPGVEKN